MSSNDTSYNRRPARDVAMSVRGLSKSYMIAHNAARHTTAAEALAHRLKNPLQKIEKETFWALKDVSFDVQRGDVVGIIGRNGAGKSTLLKVLSRITEPTSGEIDLYGRVGSLLEVGTGFHQELTGRENIFLNGAILGMKRREIAKHFDAIVDFAGVEQFLDTPVKRYSSGMYVRLAFAVAAHLNPEILIVDEVLAVGDAEFQKKCLGKMQDVAREEGRTILFVSHNMAAVSNLCSSAIFLSGGQVKFYGTVDAAIERYLDVQTKIREEDAGNLQAFRPNWAKPIIRSARVINEEGEETTLFPLGADIHFEIEFNVGDERPLKKPVMGVVVSHRTLGVVGGVNMRMTGFRYNNGSYVSGVMRCKISRAPFLQGSYTADLFLGDGPGDDLDTLSNYLHFDVEGTDVYGTGQPPYAHMGTIFFEPEWEIVPGQNPAIASTHQLVGAAAC